MESPGPTTDVYSLGCLLWAAVSGHAPYSGTSDYQIVNAHLSAPIPQLPETSSMAAAVNRVLRIAMAKQPGERYRDAGRDARRPAGRAADAGGSRADAWPGRPRPGRRAVAAPA